LTRSFGVGETLAGKYRIVELLGRGGMGAVYRGEDTAGHPVAVKQVLASFPDDDQGSIERFRREARLAAAVRHENVVGLIETGEHDGAPFIVFDLVTGGTLKERLRARGAFSWREAASLGAGIARGLAAIHSAGLVHRDVKPENVLLDAAGRPLISDLGLARQAGVATGGSLTRTGELLGTLEYVAPEQVESARRVDSRADLYSFGATLYALLTGRPPFEGQGLELVKKHMTDAPRRPSEVVKGIPRALDDLVLALLAKSPDDRPASAIEVARRLDAIASGAGGGGRRTVAISVGVVVVLLGGLALAWGATRGPPPVAAERPHETATTSAVVTRAATADETPAWFQKLDAAHRPAALPKGIVVSSTPGEYVNVKDGSVLLFVPKGKFRMGWVPPQRQEKSVPDSPEHDVSLSAYFIGKYEVTRRQFEAFVNETKYVTTAELEPKSALVRTDFDDTTTDADLKRGGHATRGVSWRQPQGVETIDPPGDDHPVVQVSWEDACAYCKWAGLRLPSEAQWERAAAWDGRRSHRFPWGDEEPADGGSPRANLRDVSVRKLPKFFDPAKVASWDDGYVRTAPVGSFASGRSFIEAHDMAGNVGEWCQDAYLAEAYKTSAMDPCYETEAGSGMATKHVTRGGSWNSPSYDAVTARRAWLEQNLCTDDIGFRVARSIP
jgi:formylglycine-generating enzyme required for sulfatase activity